jgi:uncharacterized protein YbjT (DUF2867 family)
VILITGAGGKTGLAVIRAATTAGQTVRALVRREDQVDRIRAAGAHEWVVGDMRHESTLGRAARGVHTIYHICPNVHPDEVQIGRAVIAAARPGSVERIVYHSVLHPQIEAMPHHWQKMRVEALLFESGVAYTILQPASYMQNILAGWRSIVANGVYAVPYPPETRLGMVDLEDVAAVAAVVLADRRHDSATYELAGPEALTQSSVVEVLTRRLGRPVRAVELSLDEWALRARRSGLGEHQIETLRKMFDYYGRFGFWGNPHALAQLLGRNPTTFEMFVVRTMSMAQR